MLMIIIHRFRMDELNYDGDFKFFWDHSVGVEWYPTFGCVTEHH